MEDLRGVFEREIVRPGSAVDGYTGTNRFSQKIGWQFHMQSTVIKKVGVINPLESNTEGT